MKLLKYSQNSIRRILLIKISFHCSSGDRNESPNATWKWQKEIIFQELHIHIPSILGAYFRGMCKEEEMAVQANTRTLSSAA